MKPIRSAVTCSPGTRYAPETDTLWLALSNATVSCTTTATTVTVSLQAIGSVRVAVFLQEKMVMDGILGVSALICDGGTCSPLPPAPHHLAFIGDSITCGYGIDAASPEDAFSIATEHAAKSYAAQTAKLLHADAHILSYSGFGVYSGFPEESCKNETDLLPLVYEAAGFYHYQPENWETTILLPFAPPEAVILYLGTNDSAYLHLFPEEGAAFQAAYAAFLQKLHSQFPTAFLVCMIGMSSDLDAAPFIRNAVAATQQQDNRLALCDVRSIVGTDFGANHHPGAVTQRNAAKLLADLLRKHLPF